MQGVAIFARHISRAMEVVRTGLLPNSRRAGGAGVWTRKRVGKLEQNLTVSMSGKWRSRAKKNARTR